MKNIELTYKLKVILVAILGVLLGIIIYKNKVSYTIVKKQELTEMSKKSLDINKYNNQIIKLKKQSKDIDFSLSLDNNNSFESFLISKITNFNANLKIVGVSDIYTFVQDSYKVKSVYIVIEKDYHSILKLTHFLETNVKSIKTVSIDFYSKKKTYNSSKKNLYAKIYFQYIEKV